MSVNSCARENCERLGGSCDGVEGGGGWLKGLRAGVASEPRQNKDSRVVIRLPCHYAVMLPIMLLVVLVQPASVPALKKGTRKEGLKRGGERKVMKAK